ncbi:transglutaminase-like domain-containing protein [Devosia sp.]|uniref:transglutaminase-like domain-containing protein n=1 Tax=Devosia sp. TaxID=1871048 RepID=UPI003A8F3947
MKFTVETELQYDVAQETLLILNIEAQEGGEQKIIEENFSVSSGVEAESFTVPETGNRYRRLLLPNGTHVFHYHAVVDSTPHIADPSTINELTVSQLPFEVLSHLSPSRYCQSDLLNRFAWREFGNIASGHDKVTAICNWIYENVDYRAGSSDSMTSANDTFIERAGVCRDFAHLGITFARALGIPARFVSAYAHELKPQDFHAVFEAFLGDRWYLFDATRLVPLDGLIKIAVGRDAADSAFSTFYGDLSGPPKEVSVHRHESRGNDAWTAQAISISGH